MFGLSRTKYNREFLNGTSKQHLSNDIIFLYANLGGYYGLAQRRLEIINRGIGDQ
jgi:hypothetical protein